MKSVWLSLVVAAVTLSQGGCLWLALGAAGAAGAAGYAYYQGEKSRQYRTAPGEAVPAARAALVDLGFPIRGEEVREGQPLLELHHRDRRGLAAALALCRPAVTIGDAPPETRAKVLAEVRA